MRREMYAAKERAVVGDGGNRVDPPGQLHSAGREQVPDVLHRRAHLFAAARPARAGDAAAAAAAAAAARYEGLPRDAGGGRVQQVIDALKAQAEGPG